jgi:predicted acylesterase/phospholipase RssA
MPYNIELMAIGEDIYSELNRAAAALNGVQDQFRFYPSQGAQSAEGIDFKRDTYVTAEIWTFLREQRRRVGGYRPYIMAFVTRPLQSANYTNLFGSHEGEEGLAVVTTHNAAQYVKEITRYCCYYLVRYALSFINPHIQAHEDEARKKCYFHFKRRKLEIRESMDSGDICDKCRARLDTPADDDRASHRLSVEEREALRKMLAYVSGALPYAIVMKGGGVKGLAFAGALLELENYYWFDRHVGTSAGAIAAVLLAASYTPGELATLLLEKSFRDFLDARWWKIPFNLLCSQGCFPGETCRLWIADLLTSKTRQLDEVRMSALNGALVYAARQGSGTLTFDSLGERKDTVAAFAARCSMSIPLFFFPVTVDGRRVFDGGLRNNFPLTRYLTQDPRSNFIALYLGKPDNTNRRSSILPDLFNIVIEGEERQTVDAHRDKVIVIDTSPIGTVDFNLAAIEKEFLLRIGRAAALKFWQARKFDDSPSEEEVASAHSQAETCRQAVIQMRRRRNTRHMLLLICVVMGAVSVYLLFH